MWIQIPNGRLVLEMRYPAKIGRVGLALAAMLLIGAIGAGGASAAEFAASPSFPLKFSGEGKAGLLETKAGHSVTCSEGSTSGEVAGSTEAKASVVFKGCHAEHLPLLACTSSGRASGEIATSSLKATPVDVNAAKTEAGILLQPASGEVMAEFKCSLGFVNETLTVTGSVIGKVPNAELNSFRSTLHLEFIAVKGVQQYTQVEGTGPQHVLLTKGEGTEPFAAEQSGIHEAVPGSTTLTAEGGKQLKVIP
jgi:hypothetical protein